MISEFCAVPGANLQIFPPNSNGNNGQGYQTLGALSGTYRKWVILGT